jgi:hypothetical protein
VPPSPHVNDASPATRFEAEGVARGATGAEHLEPGSPRTPPGGRGKFFDDAPTYGPPPVEQFNLPRYEAERIPNHILALDNKETLDRLDAFVKIGLQRPGRDAFNLEPLRQHFISELGPEHGQAAFKQWTDLLGAVSSVSTDLSTVRNASYYFPWLRNTPREELLKYGTEGALPEPIWDPAKRKYVLAVPLPPPYGHIKQGLHALKVGELVEHGGIEPLSNPKLASVAEQFRGNEMPIPLDRHVLRALGVDRIPDGAYGFIERLLQKQALKMGLTPGQYQAALRVGAAERTGLRSPDPMLTTFERRLEITADHHNISKREALRRFERGELRLRSLGPLAAGGTIAAGLQEDEQ